MVEYNDIIQDGVASLSNEWFEKKERTFKAHKNYNPKLDIIRIEEIWTSPSYSIGGPDAEATEEQQKEFEALIESLPPIESIEEERITEVTLRQYCSCYLPIDEITGWGSSPVSYDVMDKSNNVPELAWAMVHDILAISKGIDDFVAISEIKSPL